MENKVRIPKDVYALAGLSSVLCGWGFEDLVRGVYSWGLSDLVFAGAGSILVLLTVRKIRKAA